MPRPRLQRAATARREKVQLCIREQIFKFQRKCCDSVQRPTEILWKTSYVCTSRAGCAESRQYNLRVRNAARIGCDRLPVSLQADSLFALVDEELVDCSFNAHRVPVLPGPARARAQALP
jgi:hypothetical protein